MAAADINLYTGAESTYVLNGTDISEHVSDFEFDSERDVVEFQGSGSAPTWRRPAGKTNGLTFTVKSHPTPLGVLEAAYYADPQPNVDFVVTRFGTTKTYTIQISHLTDTGGSGDALTTDVEAIVIGDPV